MQIVSFCCKYISGKECWCDSFQTCAKELAKNNTCGSFECTDYCYYSFPTTTAYNFAFLFFAFIFVIALLLATNCFCYYSGTLPYQSKLKTNDYNVTHDLNFNGPFEDEQTSTSLSISKEDENIYHPEIL
ncbi:hypothetical protein KM1_053660 [Entamoeba histolytica HM-3:IMSS]|uniref:Uncharacterized protein n=1 Tax=Entamoeba histolytica HM-3:IMSS TaxID=885315 RepID=M7WHR5_ENTHI|nr:hypothetical protein KM1_053660 [Entamoeba histolytica HM-3:IMSS]